MSFLVDAYQKCLSPAGLQAVAALEAKNGTADTVELLDRLVDKHGTHDFEPFLMAGLALVGIQVPETPAPARLHELLPAPIGQTAASAPPAITGGSGVVDATADVTALPARPEQLAGPAGSRPIYALDAIFEHQGLTAAAVLVYLYLWRRAGKKMVAWPKQETMAKACRLRRQTVNRATARLGELGIITWSKGTFGGNNVYTILPPEVWKRAAPIST